MKNLLTIALLLVLSPLCNAQKEGLNSIKEQDLKAYMTFFASDEMEGRETGTRGNEATALYIKSNLMRLELKPVPQTGSYYQMIPLISKQIRSDKNSIIISNTNVDRIFSNDSIIYLSELSKTIDLSGNVVFAGYGYENKETGYNDLEGIDLKEKIVLYMTENPQLATEAEGDMLFNTEVEVPKFDSIFSKGAKAIMLVYNPRNKYSDAYMSGLADLAPGKAGKKMVSIINQEDNIEDPQVVIITQHTADMLLESTGSSLRQMEEKIISEGKPVSIELKGITASFKTNVETSLISGPNIIGIIEGSDPALKNECVIYTAHFDHEGINDKGEVFNGANDNASGSIGMLQVAQAFMKLKKKPLRTIVFVWVNGEEKGILGSTYYTENPVIPLEKTLVDINLDMIGRSRLPSDTSLFMGYELSVTQPGEILVYTEHESSELDKMLKSSAEATGVKIIDKGAEMELGTSDHSSFTAKGVPAFLFNSGIDSDLHSIRDDVEKIDFDKMEKVSKMVFLFGYKVANQKTRIKIDNPEKKD